MHKTTIVFQGDSVTDAGRAKQISTIEITPPNGDLGTGYVSLIAAQLLRNNPHLEVYNRGIGGNRICDMYARWKEHALNLQPDLVSILNGINDIGFEIRCGCGADREKYAFIYDRILYETLQAHPTCKLILCQPFLLRCQCEHSMDIYNNWNIWHDEIVQRGLIVAELAKKYDAVFVPMGDALDAVCQSAPAEFWSADCIHPTLAGHQVLAECWLQAAADTLRDLSLSV